MPEISISIAGSLNTLDPKYIPWKVLSGSEVQDLLHRLVQGPIPSKSIDGALLSSLKTIEAVHEAVHEVELNL